MKRRLLVSTLAIVIMSIVLLGVPLALLARHQIWATDRERLRAQAAAVAAALEDRLDTGQPVDLSRYSANLPGRRLLLSRPDGSAITAGPPISGAILKQSVAVSGSTITVQAPESPTASRATAITLLVVGIAGLAVLAAIGLALRQARRLGRPLAQLAYRAETLGRADFSFRPIDSGVPEIDRIAAVLDSSSRKISNLIELQREFASDAAHQLRTPLTGIGLRLEEMGRIGDVAVTTEADDALAQVERLDAVISSLLARARGDSAEPKIINLSDLVEHEAALWRSVLAEHSRELAVDVVAGVHVLARQEHLVAVLTSLLENSVTHGTGTVTISMRASHTSTFVRIRDEGIGVPDGLAAHIFDRRVSGNQGTGIGLALARSLAAAEGGDLSLACAKPPEFVFCMPRHAEVANSRADRPTSKA